MCDYLGMNPVWASRFGSLHIVRRRVRMRGLRWRAAVLLVTAAIGLGAFVSGVTVTERPQLVVAGLLPKLYYTVGLFLFGGLDLGTPVGGPAIGRVALWVAYFVAPAITASAVIEALLRLIGADLLSLRRLDGHIVVAGCSRLTELYLERLRAVEPLIDVLVVGSTSEEDLLDGFREQYHVQAVIGDITTEPVLRRLQLDRAARLLLLTEDDFTNLDGAAKVLELAPSLADHVIAHVSDLRFMRALAGTRLAHRAHIFNGHQIAAAHLVDAYMLEHFERTEPRDLVVLAGFGRFGQSVLDELQSVATGAFDRVVIIDAEGKQRAAIFDEQVGFQPGYHREVVEGDLQDPGLWEDVEQRIDLRREAPVFVVGSGVDRIDLRIAMRLANRYTQGLVIARSDREWSFSDALRESGVQVFSVAQLVAESMPNAWFGPRTRHGATLDAAEVRSATASMVSRRISLDGGDTATP